MPSMTTLLLVLLAVLRCSSAKLCPVGMQNGRILEPAIQLSGIQVDGSVRLNDEPPAAFKTNTLSVVTIDLPDPSVPISVIDVQGGVVDTVPYSFDSVAISYLPPNATTFTTLQTVTAANATNVDTPLRHTLSTPIKAQRIRFSALNTNAFGILRVELYTECLFYTSFQGQLGRGWNGTHVVQPLLSNGLNLQIAGTPELALVENVSDTESFVVRNTGTDTTVDLVRAGIALPSNVGRIRISLSIASGGKESTEDSIKIRLIRGSGSPTFTLAVGAIGQQRTFKHVHQSVALPIDNSSSLQTNLLFAVNDRGSQQDNEYRLFFLYIMPEILDCQELGTYTSNGVCLLCDGINEFQNQTNQTACLPTTQCDLDSQYELIAATSSTDRECAPLTNCSVDQYISLNKTLTSDRLCHNLTDCLPGTFVSSNATTFADRNCSACPANEYQNKSNQPACEAVQGPCSDTEYESETATSSSDRVCLPLNQCADNQFISVNHTLTSDRVCANVTDCEEGEYIEIPKTLFSNQTCAPCLRSCNRGSYLLERCSANSTDDNVCVECSQDCDACTAEGCDECSPGKVLTQAGTCTDGCPTGQFDDKKGACQSCNPACSECTSSNVCTVCLNPANTSTPANPIDYTYKRGFSCIRNCTAADPTLYGDNGSGTCRTLLECTDQEFESLAPTYQSNRECTNLTNCVAGQYPDQQPTDTSDRSCKACPVGTFDTVAGNLGSLSDCVSCAPGTTDDDQQANTSCIHCLPGRYLNPSTVRFGPCDTFGCAEGSTDHDRNVSTVCQRCPAGHYTPRFSAGPCSLFECADGDTDDDSNSSTPCQACLVGQFTPPSKTGPCTNCPIGTSDHDLNPFTPCQDCIAGQFDDPSNNQVTSCKPCAVGTFTAASRQTQCTACISCNVSEFETVSCTASTNRQCQRCKVCPADDPIATACNATHDSQCKSDLASLSNDSGSSSNNPIVWIVSTSALVLLLLGLLLLLYRRSRQQRPHTHSTSIDTNPTYDDPTLRINPAFRDAWGPNHVYETIKPPDLQHPASTHGQSQPSQAEDANVLPLGSNDQVDEEAMSSEEQPRRESLYVSHI
eukprot:m.203531 g.203531  ORF g.203531 m.203531 type:complete len:1083 (-) comp17074_c0_seq5:656-3904(-)